jgi:hypothetical protein
MYLDNILIFSNSKEEHTEHVRKVLDRLRKAKLYIKLSKCEWNTDRTEYLGYVVTPEGVSINLERVKII